MVPLVESVSPPIVAASIKLTVADGEAVMITSTLAMVSIGWLKIHSNANAVAGIINNLKAELSRIIKRFPFNCRNVSEPPMQNNASGSVTPLIMFSVCVMKSGKLISQ